MSRRSYLSRLGAALGFAAAAGCLDFREGSVEDASGTDEPTGGDERGDTGADEPSERDADDWLGADYETTTVRVAEPGGEVLGSVLAAIADTPDLQHLGLSDTAALPEDRGMLFVYEEESARTFVMREMEFGIDIVYADAAGEITRIHHAPEPGPDEDGADQRYPGYGQYVLEVGYEWTADRGVETGDVLAFEL